MKTRGNPGRTAFAALAVLATLAVLALTACKDARPPASPQARVYVVRGQVAQVPVPGRPGTQFIVHHEAVPDFVDKTGAVVGMESMTMYLPTAKGLSLATLQPGDKIRFDLSVDWPNDRVEVTRIDLLPPETRLSFEANPGVK